MSTTDDTTDAYVSYADELDAKEGKKGRKKTDTTDESQGDAGDQQGGDAGGGVQPVDPVQEEEIRESWLEKLKLIFIAPFSHIIPGTVSYTAENELSKKAFFLRVGLYNQQIEPTDIADPDLMQKLEDRHQERRARFGLGPSLQYVPPKPAANAPALGTSSTGENTGQGGSGTNVTISSNPASAEAIEKAALKNATVEERALMAEGADYEAARAEADEYITPEEFALLQGSDVAFANFTFPIDEMALYQAFNVIAARTWEDVEHSQRMELQRSLKLTERDGKQESVPSFPNPENH